MAITFMLSKKKGDKSTNLLFRSNIVSGIE